MTALSTAAHGILEANWTGSSTVPSRGQYPHQWSWDAAFNAIGWAHVDYRRAAQELESLLRGQWADGRVPHIVFDESVPEEAYFPGPSFWRASTAHGVRTSGLTQPPLHAIAALEIARRATDEAWATSFLRRVHPALTAQHAYLSGHRDAGRMGLAAIVHPWESGLDNAPMWDEPLQAVTLPSNGRSRQRRHGDGESADGAQRPSDDTYDRYVFLAQRYRERAYEDGHLRSWSPFLVEDPMFNAIWISSTHALAEIAVRIGADPMPHHRAADRIHRALMSCLWNEERKRFEAYDVRNVRFVDRHTIASLTPLLDPELPERIVDALACELRSERFWDPLGAGVASHDRHAEDFDARRYWRGPVWINTNWLLARGLRQHGRDELAAELERATVELVSRSGFREYFDPATGEGYGSTDFSWSAALVLDLLAH